MRELLSIALIFEWYRVLVVTLTRAEWKCKSGWLAGPVCTKCVYPSIEWNHVTQLTQVMSALFIAIVTSNPAFSTLLWSPRTCIIISTQSFILRYRIPHYSKNHQKIVLPEITSTWTTWPAQSNLPELTLPSLHSEVDCSAVQGDEGEGCRCRQLNGNWYFPFQPSKSNPRRR